MAEAELDYGVFVLTLEGIDEATRRDCASRYSLDRLLAHLREFSSPGRQTEQNRGSQLSLRI